MPDSGLCFRSTQSNSGRKERRWLKPGIDQGFSAVKFAAVVAHDGEIAEMQSIREAIGPRPQILVDLHWRYTDQEAIKLITALEAC